MAEKKHVGLFWGKDSLCCIEIAGTTINQLFSLPLPETINYGMGQNSSSQNSAISALIKDTFKQYNINVSAVNLSLPVRDIIFRTFIIPWMQAGEVKGVVEFEARKYIPFALEELNYAYHSTNIIQDGSRKIRIVFIAIKKETLESYTSIFEEVGISVTRTEPAPFSLIRALTFKEALPQDQDLAIIEKSTDSGKIVIVDKGIPQFVREFQLRLPSAQKDGTIDQGMLMTRLVNEIRVSLDYFNRQHTHFTVEQLLLISLKDSQEFGKKLEEDLRLQVTSVDCQTIFDNVAVDNIGYLNAFGVGLSGIVSSPINLDLASKKTKKGRNLRSSQTYNFNLQSTALVFFLCVGVLAATLFWVGKSPAGFKNEIARLKTETAEFKNTTTGKLKEQTKDLIDKSAQYSNISKTSEIAYFAATLTNLLPDGVWMNRINFIYTKGMVDLNKVVETKSAAPSAKGKKAAKKQPKKQASPPVGGNANKFGLQIDFGGYAYLPNINEQFKLVNDFLTKIKNQANFKEYFKIMELKTVKSQQLGDNPVTYYEIRCLNP